MGQVSNVRVIFERKRQPVQFESSGATVEFFGVVNPGEDHEAIARELLGQAKTLVLTELALVPVGQSASAHDQVPAAEGVKGKPGRKPKEEKAGEAAKPAQTNGQISTNPENRVGPEDIGDSAPLIGNSDIPGEAATPTTAVKATVATLTAAELTKEASTLVQEGKLDATTIKALSREFGAEKISGIPVDKLPAYKVRLDTAVKTFASASDI